ncbi:MAG: hypothetical protein ACI9UU_001417 [Candidatus Azotimanducaceae bacterium]|jgi:hypothetical protein
MPEEIAADKLLNHVVAGVDKTRSSLPISPVMPTTSSILATVATVATVATLVYVCLLLFTDPAQQVLNHLSTVACL